MLIKSLDNIDDMSSLLPLSNITSFEEIFFYIIL